MTQSRIAMPPPSFCRNLVYKIGTTSIIASPSSSTREIELPSMSDMFGDVNGTPVTFNQAYDVVIAMNADAQANGTIVKGVIYRNGHLYAEMDAGVVGSIRLNILYMKSWTTNW